MASSTGKRSEWKSGFIVFDNLPLCGTDISYFGSFRVHFPYAAPSRIAHARVHLQSADNEKIKTIDHIICLGLMVRGKIWHEDQKSVSTASGFNEYILRSAHCISYLEYIFCVLSKRFKLLLSSLFCNMNM